MINLKHYGYTETESTPDNLTPARITACHRDQYTAVCEHGEIAAVLKGSFMYETESKADFPCVGDFVWLDYNQSGSSRIVKLLPRHSKFSRADFSGHAAGYAKTILEQVVAVNFDFIFIVTSLNNDFKVSRVVRYLTQARQSGAQPVVILTKADLVNDASESVEAVRQAAPEVPVHAVSSHTGLNMDALKPYLAPAKTIVFLGMSGVGKSSLLNALMGSDVMAVKEIREDDSRGRHTTTHRQLFMLTGGAMVIDTPGMRELGLIGADEGISASFTEVEDLFSECRFSDCKHESEPGCAVQNALKNGSLTQKEWQNYQHQIRENKFVDDRAGFMREKNAWGKEIALFGRQHFKKKGKKR